MSNTNPELLIYKKIFSELGINLIITDMAGNIIRISKGLMELLDLKSQPHGQNFQDFLMNKEIFQIFLNKKIDGELNSILKYRTFLKKNMQEQIAVEISSFQEKQKNGIEFIWFMVQNLPPEFVHRNLDTGSMEENIKTHQIANKYLSNQIINKARQAVRQGMNFIPGEVGEFTLFFGDLASFTSYAEEKSPEEIIRTLNRTIGAASSAILHWDGIIDKYIGDSIFAIFLDPLKAVIAAVEIQRMFAVFNEFRSVNNEEEIQIRIGINTGTCIQDTIGSADNLNLTVIGDAVNIASRLEKSSRAGQILISENTAQKIWTHLEIKQEVNLFLKGHSKQIRAYFIERVLFTDKDGKDIALSTSGD